MKYFNYLISFFSVILFLAIIIFLTTPDARKLDSCLVTKMYKVSLCEKNKDYVRLSSVSPYLRELILIAEDSEFYSHHGFNWGEMENSFYANLNEKKLVRGGSTITQQLAKNVFLTFDKSFIRKIREALITIQIEKYFPKNKILEKYLNVIELGPNLYGVAAASQHYFKKPVSDLNLLESAFLTYLIPNPKVYSRTFKKGHLTPYSRYRILDLCYRMMRFNRIAESEYLAAKEMVDQFPWEGIHLNRAEISDANPPPEALPAETKTNIEDIEEKSASVEAPTYVEPSAEEQAVPTNQQDNDSPFDD